jgi:hypothetical protein
LQNVCVIGCLGSMLQVSSWKLGMSRQQAPHRHVPQCPQTLPVGATVTASPAPRASLYRQPSLLHCPDRWEPTGALFDTVLAKQCVLNGQHMANILSNNMVDCRLTLNYVGLMLGCMLAALQSIQPEACCIRACPEGENGMHNVDAQSPQTTVRACRSRDRDQATQPLVLGQKEIEPVYVHGLMMKTV